MATQLQLRKGTKVQNDAFTGAEAELTYDSTSKGLRLHDGSKQGGYEVPVLVSVQRPTAENNYTWFRVWSDGWVEQGGLAQAAGGGWTDVNLPIEMADTKATVNVSVNWATTAQDGLKIPTYYMPSTTKIGILIHGRTGQSGLAYYSGEMSWQVSGVRA